MAFEKFKVLESNQKYMTWLGIHSYRLTEPTNEFYTSFVAYYFIFSVVAFTITSSAVYIYLHLPAFEIVSEPCIVFVAGIQVVGMFISFGMKMKKVKNLHLKLQEIVNAGDFSNTFHPNAHFHNS